MHAACWQQQERFGRICVDVYMDAWIHLFVKVCVFLLGGMRPSETHLKILDLSPLSFFEHRHAVAGYNLEVPYIQRRDVHSTVKCSLFYLVANFMTAEKRSLERLHELLAFVSPKPKPVWSKSETVKVPDNVQLSGCAKICHALPRPAICFMRCLGLQKNDLVLLSRLKGLFCKHIICQIPSDLLQTHQSSIKCIFWEVLTDCRCPFPSLSAFFCLLMSLTTF